MYIVSDIRYFVIVQKSRYWGEDEKTTVKINDYNPERTNGNVTLYMDIKIMR